MFRNTLSRLKTHGDLLAFFLSLSFAAFFFLWRLGENHLIEFDEAIYAVIAKNISQGGDWLTLTLRGSIPWFDKPPLYFWLSALSLKIFGLNSLPPRLPSALFGIGTVALTFLFGRALFNRRVGLLAALILSSTVGFLYYGRLGMVDVALSFFLVGAALFFWRGQTAPRNYLVMGLFLGLGLLTKNLLVLLVLPAMLLVIIQSFVRQPRRAPPPLFWVGLLVALAVALPWHLYMFGRYGQPFLDTYFLYHTFSRLNQSLEGESAPLFWYLTVIRTQFRLWYLFLYPALLWGIFRVIGRKNYKAFVFLLTVLAAVFLTFTFAQSKLIWFIIPIYPFLALLIAAFLDEILPTTIDRFQPVLLALFAGAVIFYNFKNLDKIISPDFTKDLVAGVTATDQINTTKPLFVLSPDFYVADFYNRRGEVLSTQPSQLVEMARGFRPSFFLVPEKVVSEIPEARSLVLSSQRYGRYLLFETK